MDGSNVITIATSIVNPVAMAVDVVTLKLYWISHNGRINVASFIGSDHQVLYWNSNAILDGIAIFEDYIYVTDTSINAILRINKFVDRSESKYINMRWCNNQISRLYYSV